MKKFFLFFLLFSFWFFLIFPKIVLWNSFATFMDNYYIVLNVKKIEDKFLQLELNNLKISYKKLKLGSADKANIKLLLITNNIEIENFQSSVNLPIKNIIKIQKMDISYNLYYPRYICAKGKSNLGVFEAKIDLSKKRGYLLIHAKSLTEPIFQKYFKKTKEGMKYEFDY